MERESSGLRQHWPRVLALLTCLTMTLVVAQQGKTIVTQHNLIQLLWDDSKQLNRLRVEELNKKREKVFLTDPQYAAPEEKPPEAKPPAPPAKPAPKPHGGQKAEPMTPRVLWKI